jgi:hypothetical protein
MSWQCASAEDQLRVCHADRTAFSRSADNPARSSARRSAGSLRNHSIVSAAVVANARNVSPAATALALDTREKPAVSPVPGSQVGMSAQGLTS